MVIVVYDGKIIKKKIQGYNRGNNWINYNIFVLCNSLQELKRVGQISGF